MACAAQTLAGQHKQEPRSPAFSWFDRKEGEPNDSEVLFFALQLVSTAESAEKLDIWVAKVLKDAARAEELRADWAPLTAVDEHGWQLFNKESTLFAPLRKAYFCEAVRLERRPARCRGHSHATVGGSWPD